MTLRAIYFSFIVVCLVFKVNNAQGQNFSHIKHYTTDDGLPHNVGYKLMQDSKGFLWVCTDDGLARFDGQHFKTYRSKDGLLSNYPIEATEAADGTIWIGSWKGGVNYLKNDSIYTPPIDHPLFRVANIAVRGDKMLLSDDTHAASLYQKKGNQWQAFHPEGKLYITKDSSVTFRPSDDDLNNLTLFKVYLTLDQSMLVFGKMAQIWQYQPDSTFAPFFPEVIQNDTVYHIAQDAQQKYWIGGRGKIWTIDAQGQARTWKKNLPPYRIHDIKQGNDGKVYFLTGLNNLNNRGFYCYDLVTQQAEDLMKKYNLKAFPSALEIDQEGNLWFTTNGDGLYCITYSPFQNYGQQRGLKGDFVRKIIEDKYGNIYAGTLNGLYKFRSTGFEKVALLPSESSTQINGFYFTPSGELMVVINSFNYPDAHLFKVDREKVQQVLAYSLSKNQFIDHKNQRWSFRDNMIGVVPFESREDPYGVRSYRLPKEFLIQQMLEYQGKLWMVTNRGLYSFKENRQGLKPSIQFLDSLKVADGLASNFVNTVAEGLNGELWIGTKEGLCLYQDGKIQLLNTKDGLVSDNCTSLMVDKHGGVWVGTSRGLSYFDGQQFINYNHKTGLVSPSINDLFLDSRQRLWIGTSKGISLIDLRQKPAMASVPPLYIKKILVNRKVVQATSEVTLKYNQRLEVRFQALTFVHPEGVRYQYRFDGEDWEETSLNFVNYNRFRIGTHLLEIRAKKYNSDWSPIQKIEIVATPPFWFTWWALLLYVLALTGGVYAIVKWRSRKLEKDKLRLEHIVAKRTHELEQQKEEIASQAEQLKEMDQVKSRFFSNISHEFKTPLTLIIGPAEKLLTVKKLSPVKTYSQYILANAHRLMKLINQLMDVSKIDSGKMPLHLTSGNLITFLSQVFHSFELLAQQKNIQMELQMSEENMVGEFDEDKLEKIFFNLLSNALKFTPEQGKVVLSLEQVDDQVKVKVSDSGAGIAPDQLPFIFDRFYQADDSGTRTHEGTGIGLALVKELVDLHQGTIEVTSELNQGTIFTVCLPFVSTNASVEALAMLEQANISEDHSMLQTLEPEEKLSNEAVTTTAQNTILVVEDNAEIQAFIKAELTPFYQVALASNGEEGMNWALKNVPDLIISDVMMPKVDGLQMVKMLRANDVTSHIPIVMLSAKSDFDSKISGLTAGSDDYLTKPFSAQELLLRLQNMLERRDRIREALGQQLSTSSEDTASKRLPPREAAFMEKATAIVEQNIDNPEFDVNAFCQEIGMSRTGLFRKLKALAGTSIVEFIRTIRLKKAAQLLRTSDDNIDVIAFQVGFGDVSYFTKCFKKQFGVTPGKYQ